MTKIVISPKEMPPRLRRLFLEITKQIVLKLIREKKTVFDRLAYWKWATSRDQIEQDHFRDLVSGALPTKGRDYFVAGPPASHVFTSHPWGYVLESVEWELFAWGYRPCIKK